ncbi:hypothetical protein QH494_05770 [Sphingomonas sp. AR_OL41]|uniref:hypothetical protein n=1 Tax=Sphingomonas sp. AR_OL41 TaxID=3042729 RepID=UPI002481935C|nr:hypothetical protein [Sphingomonas sp. AR_OL41]MDH7971684.1 hypothetical protein [Sphingomonas sp. AR_OL41]
MNPIPLLAGLLLAALPATAIAAEQSAPLPAGVDRDVYCEMLLSQVAEAQEKLTDEQKATHARIMGSVREALSFYLGSITARLSDAQMTDFTARANKALAASTSDGRAIQLQYCLNDATRRASHFADRVEAN